LFARITPCLENGKTAFIDFLEKDEGGFGSTEFIVLRAKRGISPQFVYCCARDENLRAHAIQSMVGSSGRQRVRSDCFSQFGVKRFSEQTMRAFQERTSVWFDQIRANIRENQTLAHTRAYLLPKLLTGEIEVKDAENCMGNIR
jgi:type I restriction enzyme S subunit